MFGLPLILAASAALVPPDLRNIFDPDDYPTWAMQDGASAAAILDLLIEPTGKISRCQSSATFGSKKLADDICSIVKGKRVHPARDPAGNKLHGVAHTLLKYWLPETKLGQEIESLRQAPDLILSVNRLPAGANNAEVHVALMVDETGKILACSVAGPKDDERLARAACSASDRFGLTKVTDLQDRPVRYVTTRTIELREDLASPPPDSSAARPR